jgi:uncharacterized membrane protein
MRDDSTSLVHVAALGTVAGMRSQLPLALLCLAAHQRGSDEQNVPEILTSPKTTALLLASATGEIVVDKLPFTPSRLMPGSLVVRAGIGCIAGALLSRRTTLNPVRGAVIGAVGALVGSYAGYEVRAGLVARTGLPDPLVAVMEDVVALAIGSYAVGLTKQPDQVHAMR